MEKIINNIRYADDTVVIADIEQDLQTLVLDKIIKKKETNTVSK